MKQQLCHEQFLIVFSESGKLHLSWEKYFYILVGSQKSTLVLIIPFKPRPKFVINVSAEFRRSPSDNFIYPVFSDSVIFINILCVTKSHKIALPFHFCLLL